MEEGLGDGGKDIRGRRLIGASVHREEGVNFATHVIANFITVGV